jgi:hypothetical protein
MADWRAVCTRVWKDSWFRNLTRFHQTAWLMLLTNPDTQASGIYRLSADDACHYLGCSPAKWEAFQQIVEQGGKAFFDQNWVYVRHFTTHQPPMNPNMVTSSLSHLRDAPKTLLDKCLENKAERLPQGLRKGIERLAKGSLLEMETRQRRDGEETETGRGGGTSKSDSPETAVRPVGAGFTEGAVPAAIEQLAFRVFRRPVLELAEWILEFSPDWVLAALEATERQPLEKHTPRYTKGILRKYLEQGGPDLDVKPPERESTI